MPLQRLRFGDAHRRCGVGVGYEVVDPESKHNGGVRVSAVGIAARGMIWKQIRLSWRRARCGAVRGLLARFREPSQRAGHASWHG